MKVLVAFDNSDVARKAIHFALNFKDVFKEYIICYVSPIAVGAGPSFDAYVPASIYQHGESGNDEVMEAAKSIVESISLQATYLRLDSPGEQVARVMVKAAEERGVDLIITGTRKLTGLSKVLLGSVSSELIKLSKVPVMVVPPDGI